ncbi:MAG: tetratricopeptide repeat protein [Pseudoflavonifractor sp.]|nr:tetratricopeptide repeat protein [Pseudoflavonifractor sp.]
MMMTSTLLSTARASFRALSISLALLALGVPAVAASSAGDAQTAAAPVGPASNRYERNYIVDGNRLYHQKRFAEAETMYKKALEQNPSSPEARFNLAAAYIRQSGSADPNADNNPMGEAHKLLSDLSSLRQDMTDAERHIAELANFNLGNIAFNNNDFKAAIESYKRALRIDPSDDKARQNLRLAQLKLQEQQQNDQNKDNKDQNQNQNQDNKDQNQDNKNQNQDQDKSQDKDKKDQDQNKDQNQGQDQDKKEKPDRQRSGMSDANAEQILKAMENEEAATRRRVEAERRKAEAAKRRRVTNPW